MADLENLLLQAAGRTGSSSGRKNQSRPQQQTWQRDGSYSDASDDDSDDSRVKKRPHSGQQVPLKKRLGDGDEDNFSGDDSDSAPSVGSDLYKGDSDKEELENMPELQREMILAERSTKIDDYRLRKKARASSSLKPEKSQKARKESPPPPPPFRSRVSARSDHKTAAKADALNELRAKRMKQRDPEGYSRMRDAGATAGNSTPAKRRAPVDDSDSESGDSEDGNKSDNGDDGFPSDLKSGNNMDDDSLSYEDVKAVTIRRSKLGKWLLEPFFEELIAGCFVRLGVGKSRSGLSVYKLCLVKNVDSTDKGCQYKLEGRTTNKYLNLVWGAESTAARWPMNVVSDSPPEEDEFKSWLQAVETTGGRMPTREDILDKKEAIHKTNTFVYSAASVQHMVQVKQKNSSRPLNAAAEKDRLRKEMELAELNKDHIEMDRIKARLKELEDMYLQSKEKNLKAVRLAEMNKRNRAENFKNASELKPVNTSLKAGEAGYDPFSRRWTRSTNYYVSKTAGDANGSAAGTNAEGASEPNGVGLEAGEAATAAALEAAGDAGKLIDTSAPVGRSAEQNSIHNFELSVSLAGLQKYGGAAGAVAGYLGRKAKIEATIGYKVPENDGKRHAVTLTISDYKRRMVLSKSWFVLVDS